MAAVLDMSEEELRMLLGVSVEIKKLESRVESIEAYLADAERRRINEASVQAWVSKHKGALYEATDILELCQLDAEEWRNHKDKGRRGRCWARTEEKAPGCLRPLLFCLQDPGFARGMGGRIKKLNKRLDSIREEMAQFRFSLASFPERMRPSEATPCSRTTTSFIDESTVVGDVIEIDTRYLVQVLLSNDVTAIMMVSIVGPGGIGKTTLAKKIFNDEDIKKAFGSKIWLSVTERYDELNLLRSAITLAAGGVPPPASGDKEVLTQALADALSSTPGKFLLVLDDVWSEEPWTRVLQGPAVQAARKHPGSRVIITTRDEGLVRDMVGDTGACRQHHVKPMGDKDAWSLLKKQLPPEVVGSEEHALYHLKGIGMEIIKNCGGLPLAIKAIGGLLSTKKATENEWNSVLLSPSWKTDKAYRDLNEALQLSYEDLSPALKQCFLYYSLLPKGLLLPDVDIIYMWMGEGFIISEGPASSDDGSPKEDEYNIGLYYHRSLLRRNLIEPHDSVSVCEMHDVVRSFAQDMAKEEALVISSGRQYNWQSATKLRRLCIQSAESSESEVLPDWNSISEKLELLRSLIICCTMKFDEPAASATTDDSSLTSRFPSLRVLFVRQAVSDRFLESVAKLKHLRFLWLEGTVMSRLPDDIHKLKLLQYIRIDTCASFSGELPSSFIKLERLRNLSIVHTKFTVPKGLGRLTDLRALGLFPVQTVGEWCSLQELGPLSRLRMLHIVGLEQVRAGSSSAAKAKIHEKERLRNLFLDCQHPMTRGEEAPVQAVQRVEEAVDQLCPPRQLEILSLRNYLGRRGPSWLCADAAVDNLNSLTVLEMNGLPFCTELPDGLCLLHSLEFLKVHSAPAIRRVGPEFTGSGMRPSFPRLQRLQFKGLPSWEQWQWEDDITAMPFLQVLYIVGCMLDRLPSGLASIKQRIALRELNMVDATMITVVENFPSLEQLSVVACPSLNTIRGIPKMQVLTIWSCPALRVLEGGPALHTVKLYDPHMVTLPEYLSGLRLKFLRLGCHRRVQDLLLFFTGHKPSTDAEEGFLKNLEESRQEFLAEARKVMHCGTISFLDPPSQTTLTELLSQY